MEKRKNIILIQGKDRIGVDKEVNMLTAAFRERQSDTNIEIIHIDEIRDFRAIEQMILSVGLFVEKRLFVIKGSFEEKTEKKGKQKSENSRDESLLRIIENVDNDTFILLVPQEKVGDILQSWLHEHADIRSFNNVFSKEVWQKRYSSLDTSTIKEVLEKYERLYSLYEDDRRPKDISFLIAETFEKLSLLGEGYTISKDEIHESILIEGSGRVFDFIDAVLAGNRKKSLELFRFLVSESSIYNLLPSIIGLLRGSVYVRYLKNKGIAEAEIQRILKIHPFVTKKALSSSISWASLREFYDKIVFLNIAYRSGKGLHDPELGRIFGIERAITSLKK